MVLLRCRNKRPIKGLVRLVITMNFSLNVMSPTSNCNSTVGIGASNCPLATIIWNSGGGSSFNIVCRASNQILRKSASGMALDKAPVSMSPSCLTPRNPLENKAFFAYFLMANLLRAGDTL